MYIRTLALWPAALGLRYIYQANPSCPCYNLYIYSKKFSTSEEQSSLDLPTKTVAKRLFDTLLSCL